MSKIRREEKENFRRETDKARKDVSASLEDHVIIGPCSEKENITICDLCSQTTDVQVQISKCICAV